MANNRRFLFILALSCIAAVFIAHTIYLCVFHIADESRSKRDVRLYGCWQVSLLKVAAEDDNSKRIAMLARGANIEFTEAEVIFVGNNVISDWRLQYVVDKSSMPMRIDFHDSRNHEDYKGIYKFDESRLVICISRSPDKERPSAFHLPENNACYIILTLSKQD
jgi:uncharacterized protein (TIGR03067 family)